MQKFDMHSTLFQIFPSAGTYTSLVAGAATVLVKVSVYENFLFGPFLCPVILDWLILTLNLPPQASVNHSKTIEELSNALDSISDAIGLCTVDSKLIRSQYMQVAIAKLYIAVFLFFGDAILWYKSSSASKVLHSLHRDFSERFRKSVDTIKDQAAAVRNAAELGSQAEVRVVRLDVEQLRGELNDARIGLSGELRALAEYMLWQHGENLKQHEITQGLLSTFRADAMYYPIPRSITPQPAGAEMSNLMLAAAPEIPASTSMSPEEADKVLQQLVSSHLENHSCAVRMESTPSQALFDQRLAQAINKWLCTPAQQLLYLEFLSSDQNSRADHAVAEQTAKVLKGAKLPTVMFGQGLRRKEQDDANKDGDSDVIFAMLTLASDIIQNLPREDQLATPIWSTLRDRDSCHGVDFTTAAEILEAAFQAAPANLHIILLGFPTFWLMDESKIKVILDLVRGAKRNDDTGIRMIIISRCKLHNMLKHLRREETVSVTASSSNRSLKAPIILRRPKSDTH